jgi:hypothetical protein
MEYNLIMSIIKILGVFFNDLLRMANNQRTIEFVIIILKDILSNLIDMNDTIELLE